MNFIEKNTKKVALILCLATAGSAVTTVYAAQNSDGWSGKGNARVYKTNGEIKVNGWIFDAEGTYYVNKAGNPITSEWMTIKGSTYFFNAEGKRVSGVQTIDGHDYTFQNDGKLLTGWNSTKDMYYNQYGVVLTGTHSIEGKTYLFNEAGTALTGWQNLGDKSVYFNTDGSLASGVTKIDGTDFNLNSDGTLTKGWKDSDGEKVYFDDNGFSVKGWKDIDGKKYYFNKDGYMATDTEYAGYEFDASGVATEVKEEATKSSSASDKALASADGSIASAALAQVGVAQDCTALVSNALAARGIYFHGWPADYMSLGSITSSPQAGDLIYYANGGIGLAHIAVYIGNGQAVHGGWLGGQTVVASAYVGSGPVFIRVN